MPVATVKLEIISAYAKDAIEVCVHVTSTSDEPIEFRALKLKISSWEESGSFPKSITSILKKTVVITKSSFTVQPGKTRKFKYKLPLSKKSQPTYSGKKAAHKWRLRAIAQRRGLNVKSKYERPKVGLRFAAK